MYLKAYIPDLFDLKQCYFTYKKKNFCHGQLEKSKLYIYFCSKEKKISNLKTNNKYLEFTEIFRCGEMRHEVSRFPKDIAPLSRVSIIQQNLTPRP